MSITNNDIRYHLRLPANPSLKFSINQVDSLGINRNTLMFINKPNIDLSGLDKERGSGCAYLIDDSYDEYISDRNDFIRVHNPKFRFCEIVQKYNLLSRLQLEFNETPDYIYKYNIYSDIGVFYCHEVRIGNDCRIDKGVIIGGKDFSPVRADDGHLVEFPQLGGVLIGNDVVIKYNSMIGKGTFGYTTIGDNTMIDYNCQIGHNCQIGRRCIIAAGTIIGGSTIVGDNTVIGIGAKIRNGIKIGEGASIGMGSVVIKNVPAGATVVGNPARVIEHTPIFTERGLV